MLTVTTPAADPWLLTIEQTRVAAGLDPGDDSKDEALEILRASVSAQIYDALNIAVGKGAEPTLRKERLTETIRASSSGPIILSRRHNVEVISIDGWPGLADPESYYAEAEAGLIRPVNEIAPFSTGLNRITVVYDAGFDVVPPVLASAASDLIRVMHSVSVRDPLVKKEVVDVDGVDRVEREFWVTAAGSTSQTSPVPPVTLATLKRFRNSVMR